MADLSDVELALVSQLESSVFPAGVPAGDPALSPSIGGPVRILRGWPDAAPLDADLLAGVANISVYSIPGHSRPTIPYIDRWHEASRTACTITATKSGSLLTLGGTGGPGQLVGILINGAGYSVAATGTPADAAAVLAAVIPGATASGDILTLPTSAFVVRSGAPITIQREVRRQIQGFRIDLWCPTPLSRDTVSRVVDGALAVFDGDFIPLPDGTGGLLKYTGTTSDDVPSKANLWKRVLHYTVEYPTMQTMTTTPVIFPGDTVNSISHTA